jgi:hypothetical protein
MRYYDYEWDLYPQSIVFDKELDTDNLGWQDGDVFKLIMVEGRTKLVKMDLLEKFARGIE